MCHDTTAVVEVEGAPIEPPRLALSTSLEALLFVADEPVSARELAQVLEASEADVEAALQALTQHYAERGLRLQRQDGRVQFVTAPQAAAFIERFLGLEFTSRLSNAGLETLALIAYQQPVTRAQIEAIRGVNCDGVLRTLLGRGMIAPLGRLEQAGRPILYGTTFQFLQHFGLSHIHDLPDREEVKAAIDGGEPHEPGQTANQTGAQPQVR